MKYYNSNLNMFKVVFLYFTYSSFRVNDMSEEEANINLFCFGRAQAGQWIKVWPAKLDSQV